MALPRGVTGGAIDAAVEMLTGGSRWVHSSVRQRERGGDRAAAGLSPAGLGFGAGSAQVSWFIFFLFFFLFLFLFCVFYLFLIPFDSNLFSKFL